MTASTGPTGGLTGGTAAAAVADGGFPRQYARTRGFTLGRPRSFTVAPDGRVVFLRSVAGDDPMMRLWVLDPAATTPRLVADPAALHASAETTAAERARRERAREYASGITSYATDARVRTAAFSLGGRLYVADLAAAPDGDAAGPPGSGAGGVVRELPAAGEVYDPRPDPTGTQVAYVGGGGRRRGLYVVGVHARPHEHEPPAAAGGADGGDPAVRLLAGEADPNVSWGVAEFIAQEEMGRSRGFWWSPEGTRLAAARVDESRVPRWFLSDPAAPQRPPLARPYPAAGTDNAQVRLFVLDTSGGRVEVIWDLEALPYLLDVSWEAYAPLTLVVQSRDQRTVQVLAADPDTGATRALRTHTDPAWVSLPWGAPRWVPPAPGQTPPDQSPPSQAVTGQTATGQTGAGQTGAGQAPPAPGTPTPAAPTPADARLLTSTDDTANDTPDDPGDNAGDTSVHTDTGGGTRRLELDGRPITPPGLQVRRVLAAAAGEVVFLASHEATSIQVWRADLATGEVTQVTGTDGDAPSSVLDAAACDAATLVVTTTWLHSVPTVQVRRPPPQPWVTLPSSAETPRVAPRPRLLRAGRRRLHTALLLPPSHHHGADTTRLPVLLDPYGGPGAQRVVASQVAFATSQWFADQGFAVLVTDGRGTPGRGTAWERAVAGDLLGPPLDDQVDALHAVAESTGVLDLEKVAIRGWSFGGYLAAAAVLRRPDVFHAAVAGAPVTEWRLYDTKYTERYLGHPDSNPEAYERCSLLAEAANLTRPLLLVHGLADDNVVAAHTLQLSAALLSAGRPHTVLPLSGVTHMTPQPHVAANLLGLQLAFLRSALGLPQPAPSSSSSRRCTPSSDRA